MIHAIKILLLKELKLELRRKSVVSGLALYLICLVFICYITFALRQNTMNEATWSALFWLVIMFAVVNSVGKSFIGESRGVTLYYYSISPPQPIVISKILYNAILCFVLATASLGLFELFMGSDIKDYTIFFAAIFLSSFAFASSLTLISGIAAKANNSNILMAVLSFPLMISILLMAIRVTKNVLDHLDPSASYDELFNLLAINCILGGLAYLLFPYIWRS